MEFKIKAGRFIYDKETKQVKASKEKGLIHIFRNEEEETHFRWANLETNLEEFDIIVFASDAVFEAVEGRPNTFVLKFGMDDERYFFWLQEKTDTLKVVTEINRIINFVEEELASEMIDEGTNIKLQPEIVPQPEPKLQQATKTQAPSVDLIARLTQGLREANQRQQEQQITALTHLSDVFSSQNLTEAFKEFNEDEIKKILDLLPEEHKDTKNVPSTIRSAQFLQAMDVLSDALNSENALPLFMELGLDQKFLQKNYGVEAFLLALIEKAKKK